MDENCNMVCGIDKLAELLIERGIEFCVNDEVSLAFKDDVGNLHECWMAGADENRVNALIVVTPEQLLSVPDLNGIIAENAKLRAERDYLLANSNPTATELRRVRSAWKKDRDESAKLREQVVQLKNDWESERDYANQMEANEREAVSENAKLREFAQAMAEVAYEGQMLCDKCRFSHGCYNGGKKEHEGRGCQWLLWARELGIEVGE